MGLEGVIMGDREREESGQHLGGWRGRRGGMGSRLGLSGIWEIIPVLLILRL